MSDAFWMALFAGIPGMIAAIFAGWVALRQSHQSMKIEQVNTALVTVTDDQNRRLDQVGTSLMAVTEDQNLRLDKIVEKVSEVSASTNGLKDQLVDEVRRASFAKGVKSEVDKHP